MTVQQTPVDSPVVAPDPPPGVADPGLPPPAPPSPPGDRRHSGGRVRRTIVIAAVVVAVAGAGAWLLLGGGTVSTDDAYVNGHVTLVAPRVGGQVARVLVEDNNRVRRGDLLVQLDREPFQVQVDIAQAAVAAAESDLVTARATARAQIGHVRSLRFGLERAIQDVDNQVALLRARVAILESRKAVAARADADYERVLPLAKSAAVSTEEIDHRRQERLVARAQVDEALQGVYQVRVGLGLAPRPEGGPSGSAAGGSAAGGGGGGEDLTQVPPDLDQTFATVRQAQASLMEAAAALGVTDSFSKSPRQLVADFYKRDPQGDIDRIYEQILKDAPTVKQAQAKLAQAGRAAAEAALNLRYCDVVAEIDGVVTRRNVNPGNNVVAGQNLMAVRSLTEVWVDANFKETQLARLRIGQPADVEVDMYGGRRHFKGRVSGFTMGTGSTLSLLPAENATGNFVKVVQRLPVRIDLIDYDPEAAPLFVGLSVTPTVHLGEAPTGPGAGRVLQERMIPAAAAASRPATYPASPAPSTARP